MIKEDNLEFLSQGSNQPLSTFITMPSKGETLANEDLSASFQACVMDILMAKTKKALKRYPVKTLVVAGGVAPIRACGSGWLLKSPMWRSSFPASPLR